MTDPQETDAQPTAAQTEGSPPATPGTPGTPGNLGTPGSAASAGGAEDLESAPPTAPEASDATSADAAAAESPPAAAPQPQASRPSEQDLAPEELRLLETKIEAALLTADRALPAARLAEALEVTPKVVNTSVASLNEIYDRTGRSFRIEAVAGGWQVMTLPEYADVLASLNKSRSQSKLSPAALETLAIIAYKQPIIRAEIENIRGVACGEVLRSLMERHLIKIVGRAEEIGRPMLYGTTKSFLEVFGLASLKDLPKTEELKPRG